MLLGQSTYVGAGFTICGHLRNEESPATAATQFTWMNTWGPAIVAAAQRDLCPDTLR
jgi:hypothetical protein